MRLWLIAVVAVLGCKSREQPLVLAVDPVSETDANAFAAKLVTKVRPCVEATLAPLIDQQAMAAKFATTSKLPNVEVSARALTKTTMGARMLCAWLRGIDDYKLLRVRMVGGEPHPILRRTVRDPRSGATLVGYDELQLGTTRSDHQVRMVDAYSYVQGQWVTELLGGNMQAFADSLDMLGDIPSMAEAVHTARELQRSGRNQEALAVIDKLPLSVRNYRGVQLLRLRAGAGASKEAYRQALDELERVFPGDPSIAMAEMDGAFARADYDAASRWIDVIDKAVGPDAFQQANRALVSLRRGDLDQAVERIEAAIAMEPTLLRAWEFRLDIMIAHKRWADATATMTEIETKRGVRFDEAKLRAAPAMAELVETPEYKQWLANRK